MAHLGLGLAALGRPGYMTLGHADDLPDTSLEGLRRHTHAMLDAAWAAGVRHVDTARSYGAAEAFLAAWLEGAPRPGLTVSSKWGYRYTADFRADAQVHEVKDLSRAHLEAQWVESFALLGPHLRVYQVHSATLESGVLADQAVLERLAHLRDEAQVAIGLSVTGPRQAEVIEAALQVAQRGRRLFTWVQATWNVLEQSAAPALARAHQEGLRVIIKEPLANGRLSQRGGLTSWLALAAHHATTPDALALAAALAQPWAEVVLSGAATLPHLQSNLAARDVHLDPLEFSALRVSPTNYWEERGRLPWT